MAMLSAHDTIFLLPTLQHIVLFRKQTSQAILFVMVHGRGVCVRTCRQVHEAHGRKWSWRKGTHQKPDPPPPKEGANAISCLLCYLSPPQPLPPSAGLVVCIRIPWDVCKNMRVPRLNPSLIGPGSLEAITRSLILAEPWPDVTRQRWCTFHLWMSPLILSPGQRPRHANRVSKILNREYHQTEPHIFLTIKLKFRKETNMPQASGNHCWSPGQAGDNACLL